MQYPEHPSVKPPSQAESRAGENDELSIARNLVATLGPVRARHAAQQFCWFGVMRQIERMGPA